MVDSAFRVQSLRHLCRRVPAREDIESFRLKMILRWVATWYGDVSLVHMTSEGGLHGVATCYAYGLGGGYMGLLRAMHSTWPQRPRVGYMVLLHAMHSLWGHFFLLFFRLLQIASFSGKMNALNEVCVHNTLLHDQCHIVCHVFPSPPLIDQ